MTDKKYSKPDWMSDEAIETLSKGYLLPGETPYDLFSRVATTVEKYIPEQGLAGDLFDCLWKGYIGLASPVASNFGTNRGLPISCYALSIDDNLHSIYSHLKEAAALSKNGGGVGAYFGNVRPAGSPISIGGKSSGVVPWMRQYDLSAAVVSQGSTRRGSYALYLPIDHPDLEELLRCKDHAQGDPRSFIDSNIAVTVTDQFLNEMLEGDEKKKEIFSKVLELRMLSGSPYIIYIDNVNNQNPECYKSRGLKVSTSNLCFTEDTLVAVADGRNAVKIKDLVDTEFPVYSARPKKWKKGWVTEIKKAKAFKTGHRNVVKVTLEDGSTFRCTPDHQLALTDNTWVEAKDSIGLVLEPFTHRKNNFGHIEINCETGSTKQGREIWKYYNGEIPGGYQVDHIISGGGDNIENLQLLSKEEHLIKTAEERKGSNNPIHKTNKNYHKEYVSAVSSGIKNPRYSGIDNFELIELGKKVYQELGRFGRKEYLSLRDKGYNIPKTFSKYRFNKNFKEYVKYVKGEKEYNGEYEVVKLKPINPRLVKIEQESNYVKNIRRNGLKVVSVEEAGTEDVYDLTVEDNHNFFIITSNEDRIKTGVLVHNCSEITLYTDENHTFVCVLSSLNLLRWDEWKDYRGKHTGKSVPELIIYLLDAVCEEFIVKASRLNSMGRAVRFAKKSRALGAGTMGLAALYQKHRIPFESEAARALNIEIHSFIQSEAIKASKQLAEDYGEPEWCEGSGMRNTHLLATAPTRTNSVISGAISQGIEPLESNLFVAKQAKGTFVRRNPFLESLLEEKGKNTDEVWDSLIESRGSVKHLDFLSEEEKEIFLTAREINQLEIIRQAAERQPYICQAQSLNLFLDETAEADYIWLLHLAAWRYGLKSLYYLRSSSKLLDRQKDIDAYNNILVTKPGCPYCKKAKEFLSVRGIKFVEMPKEKAIGAGYYREAHGTFPQIYIDKNFIGGYDDLMVYFDQKLEESSSDCVACEG